MGPPRRGEIGPKGQHDQQPRGGHLLQGEGEDVQAGGIYPVQIFPGPVHGLPLRFLDQPGHQGFLCFLFLLLRTQSQGWSTFGVRK